MMPHSWLLTGGRKREFKGKVQGQGKTKLVLNHTCSENSKRVRFPQFKTIGIK